MNEPNRNISIRPLPSSRNLEIDYLGGTRLVSLKSGRIYVRSARRSQIVVGRSIVIHSLSELIDIRQEAGSIGRIVDIPSADMNLISVLCRGIQIPKLITDGRSNFRVVELANEAFIHTPNLLSDAIRRATGKPGSRGDDIIRLGCAALLVELDVIIEPYSGDTEGLPANQTVAEIGAYIQDHSDEAFSLGELSDRCGLSPTSFSRVFKREYGRSLFDYLHRIRIQQACLYLKRSDRPVSEIAIEVGYNNVSFFNRCFRRIIGSSAVEYRKNARR